MQEPKKLDRLGIICLVVALLSSVIIFLQLYNQAIDPYLRGNQGYVSDEVWYANSARNILKDFFGLKTQHIDSSGNAYYTLIFKDFPSRESQVSILKAYLKTKNGSIINVYKEFPAISFKLPKNEALDITLSNVTSFFSGYPYPDVHLIPTYYNLEHPPLAKFIIGLSMLISDDNPVTWRIPSIIMTSLLPLIVFFIVLRLTNPLIAAFSSLLPLVDKLTFNMGFLALLDVHLAFFIALALLSAIYERYILAAIFIGLAGSVKFSGAFLIFPLFLYLLYIKKYDYFKSLSIAFLIPALVFFLVNVPIIVRLGIYNWFTSILSALSWHASSRPAGPPTSLPWEWIINRNPFYFSINPTYSASVSEFLYVIAIALLVFTPYLYSKMTKLFVLPFLWFLGIFLGYSSLPLLGNSTLYSFYVMALSPIVYTIFLSYLVPILLSLLKGDLDVVFYYRDVLKRKFSNERFLLILFYTLSMVLSFVLHLPISVNPYSIYSDIVYSIFPREGIGSSYLGIPYLDYIYEYPVLDGVLTYIAAAIAWILHPPIGQGINLSGQMVFYLILSLIFYVAGYFLVNDMYYISKKINISFGAVLFFTAMPSLIIYGIYNWDLLAIALAVRGIRYFMDYNYVKSAVFLSLAVASKLYPLFIAGGLALTFLEKRSNRNLAQAFSYFSLVSVLFLAYNLPFMFFNFSLWYKGQLEYHLNWYIEGSWLILLYGNPFKHNAQLISLTLVVIFTLLIIFVSFKKNYITREVKIIEISFLLIAASLFSSYIHTPQQQLLLLPLLLLQRISYYFLIYIFDLLNALVILTWFNYKNLGLLLLGYYPPESMGGQLHYLAIPTMVAVIRDFIMLFFILLIMLKNSSGGIRTHVLGSRAPQD